MAPLLGLQFGLTADVIGMLVVSLLLGTPTLSLLGAIAAALALGLRGSGALTALMVLPLNAPVLIFGAGAASMQAAGLPVGPWLSLLGAVLLLALVMAPWSIAAALRVACE
jgi:heme exporter protein B